MKDELIGLYKVCFPECVRSEEKVRTILASPENTVIEKRTACGKLMGASVISSDTVLMLCVCPEYRQKGIGSSLLSQSEELVKKQYAEIKVGAGREYIMPGVPTSKRYFESFGEQLCPGLDTVASDFFEKRGYFHSWNCNCFDMKADLIELPSSVSSDGDIIDGVHYRFALPSDKELVRECIEDAHIGFLRWYNNDALYEINSKSSVLVAVKESQISGVVMIGINSEGEGVGSVGCTAVRHACRGAGIATNLVKIATRRLKDAGLRESFVGYTYSGLDILYGRSGYKICTYYMMAKKKLV